MTLLNFERAGAGARVVLLHGANQTGGSWRRVTDALATDFEVLAVDLPYHGGSAAVDVSGPEELAEVVGATAGRATYVGYFIGARAALELALIHPELVERLVLVGYAAGVEDPTARAQRKASDDALVASFEEADPPTARRRFEEHVARRLGREDFHIDAEGEAIERATNLANEPDALARHLRTLGSGALPALHDRLGEVSCPVLVVYGEGAPEFAEESAEMARRIGGEVSIEMMAQAGHPAPFEQPARFAELVREFVAAHP